VLSSTIVCSRCFGPVGAGAQPVRLLDLNFHEVCAPRCTACRRRLTDREEDIWNYDGRVVSSLPGYQLEATEFWCAECSELNERSTGYAQD
jgi:hypothetical protein